MKTNKVKSQCVLVKSTNIFTSKAGYEVDFNSDKWKIKNDITINLQLAGNLLNKSLFNSYKVVLKYYSENNAGSTVRNYADAVSKYLKSQNTSHFSLTEMTNYRSNKENNNNLSNLRPVLLKWHSLQEPGVSDELAKQLSDWNIPRNPTGVAVLSNDPNKGPLTDVERESFIIKGADALEKGKISLSDFAISLIFVSLGARSEQISQLKVKDLNFEKNHVYPYSIAMPLAKKGTLFRGGFLKSKLVEDIYKVINLHVDDLRLKSKDKFNFKVDNKDFDNFPLFPSSVFWNVENTHDLREKIKGDFFHKCAVVIATSPGKIAKKIKLINRNGKPLVINSRRFRYTFATNLVKEGHDIVTVAKLLTHNGTHNVYCYFKNTVEFVQHIRKQTKGSFSDFAAAFMGKVVNDSNVAKNGDKCDMHVVEEYGHMGVCGRDYRCDSHAIVCYTCPNFQPLVEANHERLLEDLLEERSRIEVTTDDQLVIGAKDHAIKAVARVSQICNNMKNKEKK